VLAEVRGAGRPLAPTLDRALSQLDERAQRGYVTDVCYGTMRHARALERALEPRLAAPERLPERVRLVLLAGAYERLVRATPAHAAVHAWVETVKRGPQRERGLAGLVNAVLRRLQSDDLERPLGRAATPPWLFERFVTLLGADDAEAASAGMLAPEPLWCSASDPGAASAALTAEGAQVEVGPVPGSLRLRAPVPMAQLSAYRNGLVQPQNPTSLAVVHACGDVAGVRVLDLCAGSGIKGAALAARGAAVTSVERDANKLRAGERNNARLGVEVATLAWDLTTAPPLDPADVVLLDAPCSGTGTLRGHPEILLRLDAAAILRLRALQAALLATAADLVNPGGRLIYAVCALTPEEGPELLETFLNARPEFTAAPCELPGLTPRAVGAGVVVVPTDGLDGFFVATLQRASRS